MAGVALLVALPGEAQTLAPDVAKQVDKVFTKWDRLDSPGCALISNAEWTLAKRRARVAARPIQHANPVPNHQ